MKKLFKYNILKIFILCVTLGTPFLCYAQDNFNLLAEDRKILEQLNILKRNNINNDDNNNSKDVEIIKEETKIEPTNTRVVNNTQTKTPTPTVTKVIQVNDTNDNKNINQNQPKDNTFPQKDIKVNVATKAILDNSFQNNCIKENQQLEIANKKIQELSAELENKKRQLILVETEVERLSEVIEKRNRAQLGQSKPPVAPNINNQIITNQNQLINIKKPLNDLESEKADMPIVVVNVNKANLRAGPSLKDSPLLEVSKGTRLVVETRQGSWYRVMAPNGKRAWVSSDVVDFGPTASSKPSFTTRIKGYNPDVENRMESIYR